MPIRKPTDDKVDVSLFKSYVLSLGEDTATLTRGAGVSGSRIYADLDPEKALSHERTPGR